jgi:uncharacterized membrane protein YedE/YeeE
MRPGVAFACGALFAIGLAISGMTQPAKVIGFLDLTGAWDPSLALVMVGAIGVFLPVHRWSRRRAAPLIAGASFSHLEASRVDARLIAGAALFGLGWGAAGYCPGPALASVTAGGSAVLVFLGAMVAGTLAARLLSGPRA